MREGHRGRSRKGQEQERVVGRRFMYSFSALILAAVIIGGAVFFLGRNNQSTDEKPSEPAKIIEPIAFPDDEKNDMKQSGRSGEGKAADASWESVLASMSTEEKVLQLFMIQPEALTGVDEVYAAGTRTQEAINKYPVGGIIYFKQNLRSPEQVTDMITGTQKYSGDRIGIPMFIGVDEEGGQVSRISGREEFGIPAFEDMSDIGAAGDPKRAYEVGDKLGSYLSDMGFNVVFAPVADVLTNPDNTVVAKRSFGPDGAAVSKFVKEEIKGIQNHDISAAVKHFPGHGGTAGDTHEGYAYTERTLDEMMTAELVPFKEASDSGVHFIMAAHISAPNAAGDDTPASLSKVMITDVLRDKLGFKGIVITDALNMGAITQHYSSAEAAVKALQAGVDILLMPENFEEAYHGVLQAVKDKTISEERLNQSVQRILLVKLGKQDGNMTEE